MTLMPWGMHTRVQTGLIPIDAGHCRTAALKHEHEHRRCRVRRRLQPDRSPPLRRSGDNKMLAGVVGGIARYPNADVTLVRVIIAGAGSLHRRWCGSLCCRLAADPRRRPRPAGRRGVDCRPRGPHPL